MSGSQAPPFLLHFNADNISSHTVGTCNHPNSPISKIIYWSIPFTSPNFRTLQTACLNISTSAFLVFALLRFSTHWFLIFLITHHYLLSSLPSVYSVDCIFSSLFYQTETLPPGRAQLLSPAPPAGRGSIAEANYTTSLEWQYCDFVHQCNHCLNFKWHFRIHLTVPLSAITS